MGKLKVLFGAIAAVTVAVLGATLVPAASQPSPSPVPGGTETMTICDRESEGFDKEIDLGRKGFSPGDQGVFIEVERNPQTGEKVGKVIGHYVFVKKLSGQRDGYFMANGTAIFPQGKLTFSGAGKFSSFETGARFAITGGTGRYSLARGTLLVNEAPCAGRKGSNVTATITLN